MAGTFDISTINVISPNGLVTKAITASDTGYLNVPSPQFADAINLTSGQIKFPATQVPSSDGNTLDDYEEGTWTPSVIIDVGGAGLTYGTRLGWYRKIGNIVTVWYLMEITSTLSAGDYWVWFILPFRSNEFSINARTRQHNTTQATWFLCYSGGQTIFSPYNGLNDYARGSHISNSLLSGCFTYFTND